MLGAIFLAAVIAIAFMLFGDRDDDRLDCKIESRMDVERGTIESMPNCAP